MGAERGLTLVSTAIVVLWLGSYFSLATSFADASHSGALAADAAAKASTSQASVRLAPAPVAEAPTLSDPVRKAHESASEVDGVPDTLTVPRAVGEMGLAKGRELLSSGGAFPALNATYEDFASFRDYARSMLRLGARFVVVRDRRIVASADIETGRLSEFVASVGFSPIPRDYSHEPALAELSRSARERYGRGSRVKLLLPRDLDAGLFGGIAETLAERGELPEAYSEIQGRYEPAANGGVWFRVESGTRSDGTSVSLSRLLDLSALAARGSRA